MNEELMPSLLRAMQTPSKAWIRCGCLNHLDVDTHGVARPKRGKS